MGESQEGPLPPTEPQGSRPDDSMSSCSSTHQLATLGESKHLHSSRPQKRMCDFRARVSDAGTGITSSSYSNVGEVSEMSPGVPRLGHGFRIKSLSLAVPVCFDASLLDARASIRLYNQHCYSSRVYDLRFTSLTIEIPVPSLERHGVRPIRCFTLVIMHLC